MTERLLAPVIAQAVLLEHVSDALIMVDATLCITLWNQGATLLYGWDAAAALGQPLLRLLPTTHLADAQELRHLLLERVPWQGVVLQTGRDGRQRRVEIKLRALDGFDPQQSGMLLVARDITTHAEVELLLKQETARLKLLDAVAEAMTTAGLDSAAVMTELTHCIAQIMGDVCLMQLVAQQNDSLLPPVIDQHTLIANVHAQAALARQVMRHAPSLIQTVVATGQPVFWPIMPAGLFDPQGGRAGAELASLIIVPVCMQQAAFGALLVARTRANSPYTLGDQSLLQAVADRVAHVLAHVRLLQAEQQARAAAQQAMERMTRLQTVTLALAEAYTPSEVGAVLLGHGLAALDAHAGAIFTCTADGTSLELIAATGYASDVLERWRSFALSTPIPVAEAVRTGQPLFLPAVAEVQPEAVQVQTELGAFVAMPLTVKGRTLGAWGLHFAPDRSFAPPEQNFMLTLAHQCAQALERAQLFANEQQAHAAARVAQTRLSFLAQASNVLGQSLDFATTLEQISALMVPTLADWCQVDWLTDADTIEQVAVMASDPAKMMQLRSLRQRFKGFAPQVVTALKQLRMGQTFLLSEVPPTLWSTIAQDAEHQEALAALGVGSILAVPLQVRGHTLGILSLVMAESGRRYTAEDQQLVLDLAQRAAQAIDNARLYRDAQHALKLRDEFLVLASHELRTPLTVMLGYAGVLQRRLEISQLSARDQRGLGTLFSQVARLNQVVTWVFDVTRLETGELQLEEQAVDLRSVITAVVGRIQLVSSHTISWQAPAAACLVWGDPGRLEQIVHHLVQNAVKYSPNGGDVLVSLSQDADDLVFQVQDHGIGIPAEALSSLFGRFFRASNATIDAMPGLGIGLYIVRELAELHGGRVEVASTEGLGSTFSVYLPCYVPSASIDLPIAISHQLSAISQENARGS